MQEYRRLAAVELFEDPHLRGIARPHSGSAALHGDAIRLERVERVLDLPQAAVGVCQRHGGEKPETAGMSLAVSGREVVRTPCQVTRGLRAVVQRLGE